jgi:TolB-like protein/tetratricopeptide (TPR) repeat protein
VLPFASVGSDTANLYFAEGISDELTTALARLPGLRLAGRSSSARLKQRGASAQEIGSALTVGAVLDGTVRRAGDRIRVSAELTSTDDGHVLWKDSYQRELKDVFAVQDDITRKIVEALQVQLVGGQSPIDTTAHGTSNLAAYDLYLRGLQLYRKRGAGLAQSERYLTEAIALDTNFARAHAMLASVLIVTPYYFDTSMASVLPRARAAAERAVALDDGLPAAHLALGHVHFEAFEWREAEAELRRAMALDPNNGEIAYRLGILLLTSGRVHESIDPLERARTADPLYALPREYLAWALVAAGRKEEALAEARRADEIDPTSEAGKAIHAYILLATGQRDEAVALARRMVPRAANLRRMGYYGQVLGLAGERDDARRILRGVEATPAGASGRSAALTYLNLAL